MARRAIFLSHAWEDRDLAQQYADELRARGYDVWIDLAGFDDGTHISLEITTQLDARDVLVVLWTTNSVSKPNVLAECRYFTGRQPDWPLKRFIAVHAAECNVAVHLDLGLTPEKVAQQFVPGQYKCIDGRRRPVSATVDGIVASLDAPVRVPPPFRLDGLTGARFVDMLSNLFTDKSARIVSEPLSQGPGLSNMRPDLLVIKPDIFLGSEPIIVEVKLGRSAMYAVDLDTIIGVEQYIRLAGAREAWLMTNGQFNAGVQRYVETRPWIKLFNREKLVRFLRDQGWRLTTDAE